MQETMPQEMTEEQARIADKIRTEFFRGDAVQAEMEQRLKVLVKQGEKLVKRQSLTRQDVIKLLSDTLQGFLLTKDPNKKRRLRSTAHRLINLL